MTTQSDSDAPRALGYDAFISYSHGDNAEFAPDLQRDLQAFIKPWYRRAPFMTVALDKASFAASSDLGRTIEDNLDGCKHLVLLLSPKSASSSWINDEIEHWLSTKGAEHMTFVITHWDSDGPVDDEGLADLGAFGWNGDDVPPALRSAVEEPLAVDLRWANAASDRSLKNDRWRDDVAEIAAAICGKPKDALIGQVVAMRTRARVLAGTLAFAGLILVLAAVVGGVVAWSANQAANEAEAREMGALDSLTVAEADLMTAVGNLGDVQVDLGEAKEDLVDAKEQVTLQLAIAESVRLAIASQQQLPRDPGLAALLALEAANASSPITADAHAALYNAVSSPWRADLGAPDTEVGSAEFSSDETLVVTASEDGTARVWDVGGTPVATLKHADLRDGIPEGFNDTRVSWAGFSPDGRLIVTTRRLSDAGAAWIWDAEAATGSVDTPIATLSTDGFLERAEFSTDGTRLLTMTPGAFGQASTVQIWDTGSRGQLTPLATLPVEGGLSWAEFSPDGTRIVTAAVDIVLPAGEFVTGAAQLWDATGTGTLTPLKTFVHAEPVRSARFSPDGQLIVTAGGMDEAAVWDLDNVTAPLATLPHPGEVIWAEFSAERGQIITAGDDGTALVWDASGGYPVVGPPATLDHGQAIVRASFSDDGTRVLTAGAEVRVWDVENLVGGTAAPLGTPLASIEQQLAVTTASFNASGTLVVTATGSARVWEADGSLAARLDHDGSGLIAAMLSTDGGQVVAITAGFNDEGIEFGDALIWEPGGTLLARIQQDEVVRSAHFAPDGSVLVVTSSTSPFDEDYSSTIQVLDPVSASALATLRSEDRRMTSAMFSPDGTRIVTAGETPTVGVVDVWNADLSAALSAFEFDDSIVISAAFNPDRVIVAPFEGEVQVWDLEGTLLATLQEDRVGAADFTSDGNTLVTARFRTTFDEGNVDTGVVSVWDLGGGASPLSPRALLPHGADLDVTSVAFNPEGTLIVTTTSGEGGLFTLTGVARVWDATGSGTLGPVATLPHDGNITSAFFSNDGERIVTTSDDMTVRVWRTDGTLLATHRHEGAVSSAEIDTGDSRIVTTADTDFVEPPAAAIRIWDTFDVPGLQATAQGRLGARQFSAVECTRFGIGSC